ncbi:MAG: type II CRISPR-associated endonuclease Cas1 [Candidatus Solibacter usitatus]|nr:type II CRISPR-associated endonuclease Cas1 [Candidatus Solibacter usitatus]
MTNRIIDIADQPARLSAGGGLLKIGAGNGPERTIPFQHVAAIVCSHGQITFTQAVLAELAGVNGILVVCDAKHLPVAMMLPLVTHSLQTTKFHTQAIAGVALRKRIWRGIVQAKILAQARVLVQLHGHDNGLSGTARQVRVGNASHLEAAAARTYWPLLFGDRDYRRSDHEDGRNALLNYGYAVVRAIVARALCGTGLHPGLPLHHHNQADPYPLANDCMEPFRPLVDEWVAGWCASRPGPWKVDKESKEPLLARLTGRFSDGKESRSLFDWAQQTADRLARCLEGTRNTVDIPSIGHAEGEREAGSEEEDRERVPRDVAADAVRRAGVDEGAAAGVHGVSETAPEGGFHSTPVERLRQVRGER